MAAKRTFTVPDVKQLCLLLRELGHEVATPLARILLTSEMLAENSQGNLDGRQVHSLEVVIRAVDEVRILMKRASLLTQLCTGQLEVQPVRFPLALLVEELAAAYPAVVVSMEQPLPTSFSSDRQRLFELIDLMLEVGLTLDPAPELRVASSPEGGLSFVVTAKGSISKGLKLQAFDPYRTGLKAARQGGGLVLVLAIADRLRRALNGSFEVADQLDGRVRLEAGFPPAAP